MQWLSFVLLTALCWGLYGNVLHVGSLGMADPAFGRIKAFFWVGMAYFFVAVLAPAAYIQFGGAKWTMPARGIWLSLVAGGLGAIGAFGVILALGAALKANVGSAPMVVMSLVFALAPLIAGVHSLLTHPPAGGIAAVDPRFFLGAVLAVTGGFLVARYKPASAPPPKAAPAAATAAVWTLPTGYGDITAKSYHIS